MNTNDLKYLINRYFDNELNNEEEILLFSSLTDNYEGRDYFKKQNILQLAVIHDIKPFPAHLERKIFNSNERKPIQPELKINYSRKITQLLPYAAAIVLLILAIMYSQKSETYENRIFSLTREIEDQKLKIEYLFNTLPPIEVTPDYVQISYSNKHIRGTR